MVDKVNLASYNECTGCGACAASCRLGAIRLDYDDNGFLRPILDSQRCIKCGICMKSCPAKTRLSSSYNDPSKYHCFTAWTEDDKLARLCSSGGTSTQLMIDFLKRDKSIVYGAALKGNNTCEHIAATTEFQLTPIIGTKYIQSDASWAIRDAKVKLLEGYNVLFTGTPCQIAAVKHIVGAHERLFTVEVICHGAPSKLCSDFTCKYYGAESILAYRSKTIGWCFEGLKRMSGVMVLHNADGSTQYTNERSYFDSCYSNFMNPSCFHCSYATVERNADVVIGDQWGLAHKYPERRVLGASLVVTTNDRGLGLITNCKGLYSEEVSMSTIDAPNFYRPSVLFGGEWLARHAKIVNKLSDKLAFAFLSLDWRKCVLIFPLKLIISFGGRWKRKSLSGIIGQSIEKYGWK